MHPPRELIIPATVGVTVSYWTNKMAKNSSKQWTPEDDKRLLELHAAGKSRISIAAALRRTVKSIPSRLSNLRMRPKGEARDD